MAKENEHLKDLHAARSLGVASRRQIASGLAEGNKGGHSEHMRSQLMETQAAIEAIDRAIEDEERMADPGPMEM